MIWNIIFVLIAVWVISDMITPKAAKGPKAADLFRSKPQRSSVFLSPRFALWGAAIGVIGLLVVIGRFAG